MIVPHGFGCTLVWWIDERVEGAQEFPDSQLALNRAEELRLTMEGDGWIAITGRGHLESSKTPTISRPDGV